MAEIDDRRNNLPHAPEPVAPAVVATDNVRAGRPARVRVPIVVGVVFVLAAVVLVLVGSSLHGRASTARSERKRLVVATRRVAARAGREQQLATRVDNAITDLQNALTKAADSQHAQVAAAGAVAVASDAGIGQINGGDPGRGESAFRTTVTAAADKYDIALATARADLDSAAAALADLDRATQAKR
jgi:hypothetical protein